MDNKSNFLQIAIDAAQQGGVVLKKYFQKEILKEYKEDKSLVTQADKEIEDLIIGLINKNFPEHSILGEETGHTKKESEYTWHIDPLDGTTNFENGIPIFGVSVALEHRGELVLGVVCNPITDNLFYAEKGKGAYVNHNKISVSQDNAEHGVLSIGSGREKEIMHLARTLLFNMPNRVGKVRYLGSAALELSFIARGGLDGFFGIKLKTYDFAAGLIIAQEAGAMITSLEGLPYKFPETSFIASNGVFHDILVDEIKKQKEKLNIQ